MIKLSHKRTTSAQSLTCVRVILFLLGVVLIASYYNSLSGIFIFDDIQNITDNTAIQVSSITIPELKKIFSPDQPSASRPIANLSFALNYYFNQYNPVGYHFVNILIHIINSWLIFYLFQWYLGTGQRQAHAATDRKTVIISGIAALFWATNPIQTNAVTYVVQRMTSLSTMFCLIALLFYLQARSVTTDQKNKSLLKKSGYFTASLLTWLLALASKEFAAILPLIILIHEIYFFDFLMHFQTRKKLYLILLFCLPSLFLVEIITFMGSSFLENILFTYNYRDFTLIERLLTEPRVVFHYISLFLYPIPSRLHLYYDLYPISHSLTSPPATLLSFAGMIVWLVLIYYFFKKNRLVSLGLIWTLLCLLIESTFIPLELVYEHRFYLPSVGFVLIFAAFLSWVSGRINLNRPLAYVGITILILSQGVGIHTRNKIWEDEFSFALHEAQDNPKSVRALTNLGVYLFSKAGKPVWAEKVLRKAHRIDPDLATVMVNLYVIYMNPPFDNSKGAEYYLQKILALIKQNKVAPVDNYALIKLARYLFKNNRFSESLTLLTQISKTNKTPEVFLHMGQCNIQLNAYNEAALLLKKALLLQPTNPEIAFYYSLSSEKSGDSETAQSVLATINIQKVENTTLKNNILSLANDIQNKPNFDREQNATQTGQ